MEFTLLYSYSAISISVNQKMFKIIFIKHLFFSVINSKIKIKQILVAPYKNSRSGC